MPSVCRGSPTRCARPQRSGGRGGQYARRCECPRALRAWQSCGGLPRVLRVARSYPPFIGSISHFPLGYAQAGDLAGCRMGGHNPSVLLSSENMVAARRRSTPPSAPYFRDSLRKNAAPWRFCLFALYTREAFVSLTSKWQFRLRSRANGALLRHAAKVRLRPADTAGVILSLSNF